MEGSGPQGHGVLGWGGRRLEGSVPSKGFPGAPFREEKVGRGGLPGQGGLGSASERPMTSLRCLRLPLGWVETSSGRLGGQGWLARYESVDAS